MATDQASDSFDELVDREASWAEASPSEKSSSSSSSSSNDEGDDGITVFRSEGETMHRGLGFWDCLSLVIGIMIGTGIFASPGRVLGYSGCVGGMFLVWIASGSFGLLGSLIYAELGASIPSSGGDYVYFMRGLWRPLAFLNVWMDAFVAKPASQAIISLIFARYITSVFDIEKISDPDIDSTWSVKSLAVLSIILLTGLNWWGAKDSAVLQKILMAMKSAAIGLVLILGVVSITFQDKWSVFTTNLSHPFTVAEDFSISNVFSGIAVAQWAYDGWADLGCVAEEVKDPQRNLVRSLVIGTSAVIVMYLLVNLGYLMILPVAGIIGTNVIGVSIASEVGGTPLASVMAVLIASSALGTLNGSIMTGGRKGFAAARDKMFVLPDLFGRIGSRMTPYPALILQGAVAVVFLLPSNFAKLVDVFGLVTLLIYGLSAVALMLLRKNEPDLPRPFMVAHPWIPLAFIAMCLCIIVLSLLGSETRIDSLKAIVFVLFGLPIYYLFFNTAAPLRAWCNPACIQSTQPDEIADDEATDFEQDEEEEEREAQGSEEEEDRRML